MPEINFFLPHHPAQKNLPVSAQMRKIDQPPVQILYQNSHFFKFSQQPLNFLVLDKVVIRLRPAAVGLGGIQYFGPLGAPRFHLLLYGLNLLKYFGQRRQKGARFVQRKMLFELMPHQKENIKEIFEITYSNFRKRSELVTTKREEKAIAIAASIGFNVNPKAGYKTPAAMGMPTIL